MEAISIEEEAVEQWMAVNRGQLAFGTSVGVSNLSGALAEFRKGAIDSL